MKSITIILMCLFLIPIGFSFTSFQYEGCSVSTYNSPVVQDVQEIVKIDRGVQYYVHHEPCAKSFAVRSNSLFRYSSLIEKSSYVSCERVQGTNGYSCERVDLNDKFIENPRSNSYHFTSRFVRGFN